MVKVLGEAEKILQRYNYTLGTAEIFKRLTARYGAEHGMRCFGLLRWHLGLAEDNEAFDERIWRNRRGCFARHRDLWASGPAITFQERAQMWDDGNADAIRQLKSDQERATSGTVSRSLAKWKRSLSKALDKLKWKQL